LRGRDAQYWFKIQTRRAQKIRHGGTLDSKVSHSRPLSEFFSSLLGEALREQERLGAVFARGKQFEHPELLNVRRAAE
jgi:hypothetical protein